MPRRKIPSEAFEYYRDLGPSRSYGRVADHYGVSKRAVTKRAVAEGWQGRLRETRRRERVREMNERHLRAMRLLKEKAFEALRRFPPEDVLAAARKIDASRSLPRD